MRTAVGDKEKEISALLVEQWEIHEQRALALQAAADKEREIVSTMEAQEEAQRAAEEACQATSAARDEAVQLEESRKKAEDDKNQALNSLMLEDYIPGGPSSRGMTPALARRKFSKLCQLINTPEGSSPNDMEGVRFLHDVKPNMKEKILCEFMSMGDILYDTAAVKNLSAMEELDMRSQEYLHHNVPPPTNIRSKLELFKHLFYFACFTCSSIPLKWSVSSTICCISWSRLRSCLSQNWFI